MKTIQKHKVHLSEKVIKKKTKKTMINTIKAKLIFIYICTQHALNKEYEKHTKMYKIISFTGSCHYFIYSGFYKRNF